MTIYGWDASHFDAVPNGAKVVAEGFAYMTHKAGGDKDDAELAAWWSAMKPYRDKVLLGAYWVLYPGTPSARADGFLARLDSQCPGWRDGPFILQADCEEWNGNPATKPGKADIKAFCDRLHERMPKLRPVVYAPKWAYGDSLTGLGYPLWASAYVTGSGSASGLYPGDSSSKWGSYSGQTPAILQFTSSATIAGQSTCDANAYRGSLAQLTALLAPGWETDVALEQGDIDKIAEAVAAIQVKVGTEQWGLATAAGYAARKGYEIQNNLPAQLNAVTSGTVTSVVGAIPTSQENAQAVMQALGADSVPDIVTALKAALGSKAAAVGAGLQAAS